MANAGGAYDQGVIFKFDANQNAETVLYSFGGVPGDGTNPFGSLTLSGKILYGMTGMGGANNRGTIFMFDMNKQVETVLHSFADDLIDGYYPSGSLTLLGTSLYGVTYYGGSNNHGTIFKFDTQKKAETVLYNFAGPPGDGSGSDGSLTLLGKTLYGMTPGGGAHDMGTIFKFDTQKKVETVLYSFAGQPNDAAGPWGAPTLSGTIIYGMSLVGGAGDKGAIFMFDTKTGNASTLLHSFAGGTIDGAGINGSLTNVGGALYGMTPQGGANSQGVIFSLPSVPLSTISGTVTTIFLGTHDMQGVTVVLSQPHWIYQSTTDSSGLYNFLDLVPGSYILTP